MTRYDQFDIEKLAEYVVEYSYNPPEWVTEPVYEKAKALIEKAHSAGKRVAVVWNRYPTWRPGYLAEKGMTFERFTWSSGRGVRPTRCGWVMSGPDDEDTWVDALYEMRRRKAKVWYRVADGDDVE